MGILYIVPTPVGNMEDMTFRAVRILKEVDLVLAEDTRTSGILLKHYDIRNSLMSHHKFNEHGTSAGIVNRLLAGENVALISDAGTPGISDPGFFLVREAVKAGVEVQCLPGATAVVPSCRHQPCSCSQQFCISFRMAQSCQCSKRFRNDYIHVERPSVACRKENYQKTVRYRYNLLDRQIQ